MARDSRSRPDVCRAIALTIELHIQMVMEQFVLDEGHSIKHECKRTSNVTSNGGHYGSGDLSDC